MVLQEELDMATPGDSDSPQMAENEAPSPSPSAQTTEEVKEEEAQSEMIEAPTEEEMLPGMVPDEPENSGEAEEEMSPSAPEEAEEPAAVSEEVMPPEAAPEMENEETSKSDEQDDSVEETIVKEIAGKAEDMMDEMNIGAKNIIQSLGGKITNFIGGNMRKVKSLLHLNDKSAGEEIIDEAKAMSNSTGNLVTAIKKQSKACTIL